MNGKNQKIDLNSIINSGIIDKKETIKLENIDKYDVNIYNFLKARSPYGQFTSSISYPQLITDLEYLNNLSKENSLKFRIKNFK